MSYFYDVCHEETINRLLNRSSFLLLFMAYIRREVSGTMKTENPLIMPEGREEQSSLAEILKKSEEACKNCNPLTPLICVTRCNAWKLKNEFRRLTEKVKNPDFVANLLNTLKNRRRMQILRIVSKGRYSISRLQQELKKSGYYHSRKTIVEEYVSPLVEAGLAEETQSQYYATAFGCKLNEIMMGFHDFENILPPHSECYEETTLGMLLNAPRTFKDLKEIIPAKSIARVLSRLQRTELTETSKEKDYVF